MKTVTLSWDSAPFLPCISLYLHCAPFCSKNDVFLSPLYLSTCRPHCHEYLFGFAGPLILNQVSAWSPTLLGGFPSLPPLFNLLCSPFSRPTPYSLNSTELEVYALSSSGLFGLLLPQNSVQVEQRKYK